MTVTVRTCREGTFTMIRIHHILPAVVLLLSGCAARIDLLGMPVMDTPAMAPGQRTIIITTDTRWVIVTSGETVRFVAGTRSFTWNFQTSATIDKFDLNLIAPAGMLPRAITVYVAPNPLYISNS